MEYKVLVTLLVPEIEEKYEIYLPINKYVGDICYKLSKIINDLSKVYPIKNNGILFNADTGVSYDPRTLLRNTDIKNGTELIYI
ncbi:MAG: hypothetical protein IKX00_04685 [Bacilli bacterium]|nr:hypothetical protein [Bacilli bacterium]